MVINNIVFYIITALIIFAALKMLLSTNLVHSILFMILAFIGIAFVYIMLQSDYLAIVQILVYVGAISILFVFGVMLTRRISMDQSNQLNRYKIVGLLIAVVFLTLLIRTIMITTFTTTEITSNVATITQISGLMMSDYVIAFEASGLLLLVSMIGAIIIGKGVKNPK
jgi:NADH:ubiquinone oxidoreductase subunit 6 (subunit J)